MKAVESDLFKFLQGTKQFVIPIYQRTYSWTKKQCEQLWNDIIKVAKDESIPGHFIGSIVYIEEGIYNVSSVNQLLVIDGQQRLTTLSLLLNALANSLESRNPEEEKVKNKILSYYLINKEEEDEERYKLILTQTDKPTFNSLIDGMDIPKEYSPRIIENYEFFQTKISKSGLKPEQILIGIQKLFIVDVSLDRNYDNPQLIFESLNSTGLDLSQADLIRNYILMGQKPEAQKNLYIKYWYPMETSYGYEYGSYFDRFMRDFLTIKTGSIPVMRDVYQEFKKFLNSEIEKGMEAIVSEIKYFSDLYIKMAFADSDDRELDEAFSDIQDLKVEVAYPLSLQIFNDFHNNIISKSDFVEIIRAVESYVFRRVIVGIPTNSLNKTFANLYKEIIKDNYLESFYAALQLKDSYRRFPTDVEFRRELKVKDVYNFRNTKYLLRKLENHGRKEKVNVDDYTIEHILPQNKKLSSEWKEMLGENAENIQKQYLHTICNLTLTGYNPELSDRPFIEKRDMDGGFKDSPIRLNRDLAKLDQWTESEIIKRGESISELATAIWKFNSLPEEVLDKYRPEDSKTTSTAYSIEHFEYLQGDLLKLFNLLRKRILNLDTSVREEFKKLYIAYKTVTNFVDIIPQKSQLQLTLNMDYDEVEDPKGLCKDVTGKGMWGNGNVRSVISSQNQIDDIMFLIKQSFNKHSEQNGV